MVIIPVPAHARGGWSNNDQPPNRFPLQYFNGHMSADYVSYLTSALLKLEEEQFICLHFRLLIKELIDLGDKLHSFSRGLTKLTNSHINDESYDHTPEAWH